MEAGLWTSSRMITSGTSEVLVSRSIWLARLERCSCRSWRREKERWTNRSETTQDCVNRRLYRFWRDVSFPSPCRTGGACWTWPRCHWWLRGRCGPPGTRPAGRRGRTSPSRWARTGWGGGVWAADWCSAASLVWEWAFQIPGCPHTSPLNLHIVRGKVRMTWAVTSNAADDYLLTTQDILRLVMKSRWTLDIYLLGQNYLNIHVKEYTRQTGRETAGGRPS